MTEQTFYWHDYETFGLARYNDRPAQFAGMRTDAGFEPVGESDLIYCRPAPDYLPSPEACLLTGITPQVALQKGLSEVEFARRIHAAFNKPGTLVIGYNNLKFDDEVSRALFWRNLLDIYSHQWKNGCSRWDLYPFVLAVWALRDEGIVWPESTDPERAGTVSFKLERLTAANGIEHTHAHDAMSDVSATCALAKFLAGKVPRLWQWALTNRTKQNVLKALFSENPSVWIDAGAGQKRGYMRFAMVLAQNPGNANEYFVWDCAYDPAMLKDLSSEEIARRAFGPVAGLKEGEERLPVKRLRVNTSPFVCADLRIVNMRVQQRFGIDLENVVQNGRRVVEVQKLVESTVLDAWELARAQREKEEPQDADLALYGSFIGDLDRDVAQQVARLDFVTLAEKVHEGRIYFDNPNLNELLFRMRARNAPETLDATESEKWLKHCSDCLTVEATGRRTLARYQDELDQYQEKLQAGLEDGNISEEDFERDIAVLEALYAWGDYAAECAAL